MCRLLYVVWYDLRVTLSTALGAYLGTGALRAVVQLKM